VGSSDDGGIFINYPFSSLFSCDTAPYAPHHFAEAHRNNEDPDAGLTLHQPLDTPNSLFPGVIARFAHCHLIGNLLWHLRFAGISTQSTPSTNPSICPESEKQNIESSPIRTQFRSGEKILKINMRFWVKEEIKALEPRKPHLIILSLYRVSDIKLDS
jgi:hypothetical protein